MDTNMVMMTTQQMIGLAAMLAGLLCVGAYFGIVAHPVVRLAAAVAVAIFIADVSQLELTTGNLAAMAAFVGAAWWVLGAIGEQLADMRAKDWTVSSSLGSLWPGLGNVATLPTASDDPLAELFDVKEVTA